VRLLLAEDRWDHVRELCYGQKSRIFDRRVEVMIGKAPSVVIS
jgi:hypothetical protein